MGRASGRPWSALVSQAHRAGGEEAVITARQTGSSAGRTFADLHNALRPHRQAPPRPNAVRHRRGEESMRSSDKNTERRLGDPETAVGAAVSHRVREIQTILLSDRLPSDEELAEILDDLSTIRGFCKHLARDRRACRNAVRRRRLVRRMRDTLLLRT